MWVLIRILRRHSTRKRSMNPSPPISSARLYTSVAPSHTSLQVSSLLQSRVRFSTFGNCKYHVWKGFLSTARIREKPFLRKCLTRLPPMKPPAPVITMRPLPGLFPLDFGRLTRRKIVRSTLEMCCDFGRRNCFWRIQSGDVVHVVIDYRLKQAPWI